MTNNHKDEYQALLSDKAPCVILFVKRYDYNHKDEYQALFSDKAHCVKTPG